MEAWLTLLLDCLFDSADIAGSDPDLKHSEISGGIEKAVSLQIGKIGLNLLLLAFCIPAQEGPHPLGHGLEHP